MMNAPHNIVLHATALGDRCSISDPAAYVGFKLIATMARQMHTTLQAPAIALQYAERIRPIVEELMPEHDGRELRSIVAELDAVSEVLEFTEAQRAIDRVLNR